MDEDDSEKKYSTVKKSSKWPQVFAAFAISVGAMGIGYGISWSSPALADLTDCEDNELKPEGCTFEHEFTEEEGSWIASIALLGSVVSMPLTAVLMQRFGRRGAIFWLFFPYLGGWVVLAVAEPLVLDSVGWFYAARFVGGVGSGGFLLVGPLYVVELCEPSVRGALGNMVTLFSITGTFAANLFGAFLHWPALSVIGCIPPILSTFLVLFIPETPHFLLSAGRREEAEAALRWFRGGKGADVAEDVHRIEKSLEESRLQGQASWKSILKERRYLQPLFIMVCVMLFTQLNGITAVALYMAEIFLRAGLDVDKSLWYGAAVTSVQIFGVLLSMYLVEHFGRKILLLSSSAGMAVSMAALATYFYMDENLEVVCQEGGEATTAATTTTAAGTAAGTCVAEDGFSQESLDAVGWMPLVSLICFKFMYSIGMGPVPQMMLGEFFPAEAKAKSSSVAGLAQTTSCFIVSKFQVDIENAIGTSGLYYMYMSFAAASTLFVFAAVPETKGRTPEQIRDMFQSNSEKKKKKSKV